MPATPRAVADLDFTGFGAATPSPSAWEDEVLYFLLVDRFSDGREDGVRDLAGDPWPGSTPRSAAGRRAATRCGTDADAAAWRDGRDAVGRRHARRCAQQARLPRPARRHRAVDQPGAQAGAPAPGRRRNYHGYATQDFLAVDPRFGTPRTCAALVADAHAAGLRVILDVVLNHAGDVFAYDRTRLDARLGRPRVPGRRLAGRRGGLAPFTPRPPRRALAGRRRVPGRAAPGGELHPARADRRLGPLPRVPSRATSSGSRTSRTAAAPLDDYRPSPALAALTRAYCWWIAYADLDGFRVDTVKHMDPGATRYFASVVHEFAQSIGKDRFLLVGEITGPRERGDRDDGADRAGRRARPRRGAVAAGRAPARGRRTRPATSTLFRNSELIGKDSHTWLRDTVVTTYDDHDQVRKGAAKSRLCADVAGPRAGAAACSR